MKKRIVIAIFLFCYVMLFTSCLFDFPDFRLNKSVRIGIGEKLYTEDDIWIRLDSIPTDTRNYNINESGNVVMNFTVGQDTNGVESWTRSIIFNPEGLSTCSFSSDGSDLTTIRAFVMTITDVNPMRANVDISTEDYEVTFVLEECGIAYKPNIYLYPKKKSNMTVSLNFPTGGRVIKSIPEFPDKWKKITIETNGKINDQYDYLFYEASLPNKWQYEKGWSVKAGELEGFFKTNLADYGFAENEIKDFVDYWIPRLIEHPYYNIYPQYTQEIDHVVTLKISKKPKSLLRMFYVIEPVRSPKITSIEPPEIPTFKRKGFTVAEWGVIFK